VTALAGMAARTGAQCPPSVPTGLTATRGTICHAVTLNWNDVNGATSYNVYRNDTNDWSSSHLLAVTFTSAYLDDSAWSGYQYYYWVTATRALCLPGSGTSGHSAYASGYVGDSPFTPYNGRCAPCCTGIMLRWELDPRYPWLGAEPTTFRLFRSTVPLYVTSTEIGHVPGDVFEFIDTSAVPGTEYYYWARAENLCGTNVTSNPPPNQSMSWAPVTPPANAFCSGATVVTAPNLFTANIVDCPLQEGPVACGPPGPDVWFRFNAPSNGTLHLDCCTNASVSTHAVLTVFGECPPVFPLACDSMSSSSHCGWQVPWLDMPVVAGRAYYIRATEPVGFEIYAMPLIRLTFAPSPPLACYANCDGSTLAPVLNVQDFACYLNRYAAGDTRANCDGSTTPPVLNVNDFSCFLNAFAAGCS
jgi:hypothetical protein